MLQTDLQHPHNPISWITVPEYSLGNFKSLFQRTLSDPPSYMAFLQTIFLTTNYSFVEKPEDINLRFQRASVL